MIAVKMFGSCLCVAGGGIIGREGPNLQVSSAIFNQVYKFWPRAREQLNQQSMILAGGAAGLAAAFNTPLGGVVFAIEELAKVHISQIRTAIFHAVLISGILVQAISGNYLFLGKTSLKLSGFTEILLLALAAAFIGICGGLFGRLSMHLLDWRSLQSRRMRFAMSLVCASAVAVIYYFGGNQALGSGRHLVVDLLAHPQHHVSGALGLIRGLGNFLTYAGGAIGGIFSPALATGGAIGAWLSQTFNGTTRPLYVLVGMTAFLTGLTRTPFTSMILVLEMTDSHDVILAIMLSAITAQGAAKLVSAGSFYEHAAKRYLRMAENDQ
jgi:H+/Cl- antiporter ClcA